MEKVPSVSKSRLFQTFPTVLEQGTVSWFNENLINENRLSPIKVDMMKLSQTRDPLFHKECFHKNRYEWGRSYRLAKESSKNLAAVKEEEDENREECWEPRTRANFGYMEHQLVWSPPISSPRIEYPSGLTKSQCKQFLKFNAEKMRTKYGVIQEEEEEYVVFEEKKIRQ